MRKEGKSLRMLNTIVCLVAVATRASSVEAFTISRQSSPLSRSIAAVPRPHENKLRVSSSSSSSTESNEEDFVGRSTISFSPLASDIPSSKQWKAQTVSSETLCEMTSSKELTRIVAAGSGTIEATTRDGETKKEKVAPGTMVQIEGKDAQLLWTVKDGEEMLLLSPEQGLLGALDSGSAIAILSFGFVFGFVFANVIANSS